MLRTKRLIQSTSSHLLHLPDITIIAISSEKNVGPRNAHMHSQIFYKYTALSWSAMLFLLVKNDEIYTNLIFSMQHPVILFEIFLYETHFLLFASFLFKSSGISQYTELYFIFMYLEMLLIYKFERKIVQVKCNEGAIFLNNLYQNDMHILTSLERTDIYQY